MAFRSLTAPYNRIKAISASDTVNLPDGVCDAILVNGAGNVVVVLENDETTTITGVVAGTILPLTVKRVNATSTTATNMYALYYV
jgi:hypothetical protein